MANCKVLSFPNGKGGIGKSTTTWAFAYSLANRNKKVLCIDLDPQDGNLSFLMGADKFKHPGTVELLWSNNLSHEPKDCIQTVSDGDGREVDIIAARDDLANIVFDAGDISSLYRLRNAIEGLRGTYDYILLDPMPLVSHMLTANAYVASDEIIIPCEADIMASAGITGLASRIESTTQYANPNLKIVGVVLGNFRTGTNIQKSMESVIAKIGSTIDAPIFKPTVRQSVMVQNAQAQHTSLLALDESAGVTKDFEGVVAAYLKAAGATGERKRCENE